MNPIETAELKWLTLQDPPPLSDRVTATGIFSAILNTGTWPLLSPPSQHSTGFLKNPLGANTTVVGCTYKIDFRGQKEMVYSGILTELKIMLMISCIHYVTEIISNRKSDKNSIRNLLYLMTVHYFILRVKHKVS